MWIQLPTCCVSAPSSFQNSLPNVLFPTWEFFVCPRVASLNFCDSTQTKTWDFPEMRFVFPENTVGFLMSRSSFVTDQMMTSVSLAQIRGNLMGFPMALSCWPRKINIATTNGFSWSSWSFPSQRFAQMLNVCREGGGRLVPLWRPMYFWWYEQTWLHSGCFCQAAQSSPSIDLIAKPSFLAKPKKCCGDNREAEQALIKYYSSILSPSL